MKTIITKIDGINLKIETPENIKEKMPCELVTVFNKEYEFTVMLDNIWTYESLQKLLLKLMQLVPEKVKDIHSTFKLLN